MKSIKNYLSVLSSNITTVVSGLLVGFVLPLIISVEDYGYYKTFTLYVTYLGLFSLGVIDGIVLKHGGENYDQLNKQQFRSYFRWYLIIHCSIAVLLSFGLLLLKAEHQRIILLMLIVNMFALNITGYFRQLSEITQRFKEYSIIKVTQSALTIITIVVLYIASRFLHAEINYFVYTIVVVSINAVISLWYIVIYKEMVFGQGVPLQKSFRDVSGLMYNGIPLMLANLCSTLILTIDRQFVNFLFDNHTYAIYAFAYNMLSMLTVATSAVSTVLYPSLKRSSVEDATQKFPFYISSSLSIMYLFLCLYFPLTQVIKGLLPNYTDSIPIFRVIFPGLPVSSTITVIMHNYYKMLGDSAKYFRRSVVILAVSAIANMLAYILFKNTVSISAASIITIFIWLVYVGAHISKRVGAHIYRDVLFSIVMTALFYITTAIQHWILGLVVFLAAYCITMLLLQKELVQSTLKRLSRHQ